MFLEVECVVCVLLDDLEDLYIVSQILDFLRKLLALIASATTYIYA
jgi:hypothetical protein